MKNQVLKFILKNVLSGIIIMLSMILTGFLLVFAAVVFPDKVSDGNVLHAETINNIIDNLFWKSDSSGNISYTGGNVGIGTNTPSEKLDLGGGNVKMGYEEIITSCLNSTNCNGVCTSGKYVTGGSCRCGNAWQVIHSISTTTYYNCQVQTPCNLEVYTYCANIR